MMAISIVLIVPPCCLALVCFHNQSKHKDRTEGTRERVEEKQQEGRGKEKLEEER